jgi:hypothetical protein
MSTKWHSFAFLVFLFACQSKTTTEQKGTEISPKASLSETIVIDTAVNNFSRLIAGKDSIITYTTGWDANFIKNFASMTTAKVNKIKEERLNKMTVWNTENLERNQIAKDQFVFYPFSGGDFIHVNALFPDAKEYLMVAREDVGDIPDLMQKDAAYVNEYLSDVDTILRDIYHKSYFITKNMIEDTKNRTLVNGMFPLILWASVQSGHDIVGYTYMIMNDSTNNLEPKKSGTEQVKPDAVEITIKHAATGQLRKITYISCDISNDGFTTRKSFMNYITNKVPKGCNTFVKSASYLMQYGSFTKIRSLVLDKSKFLLQDDTGIPYRVFSPADWKIELFGIYEKPVKDFDISVYQKELITAYQDSTLYKGKINFSLGYHWGSRNQNQMIAVRK